MTKHLTLLLFIGLAWGQDNPDTLILSNGPEFSGKFLGIIFGVIKFETTDKNILKPPILSVKKLSINTFTIIKNGKWVVKKDFVKISEGNINQQSYDNYQQDYQQGVAAAKQDYEAIKYDLSFSVSFSWIFPLKKKSLQLKGNGFRGGYRKEMAKLIFKREVKRTTACCLLWFIFIGLEGRDMPWAIGG